MLKCPVCQKQLKKINRTYKCEKNHSFDIAKQGYTNLFMKSSQKSGDGKEMVEARTTFLNMQYYKPLLDRLIEIVNEFKSEVNTRTISELEEKIGKQRKIIRLSFNIQFDSLSKI